MPRPAPTAPSTSAHARKGHAMPADPPRAVRIRLLSADDLPLLESAPDDVFDHAVDPRWAREFLDDPRHHFVAAFDGDRLVGFASAVHYVHPDKPPELWINEVGVAEHHQNRGIGRRLLATLFDHAATLGCAEAWVATEKQNGPARRLYEVAGGRESTDELVMFSFDLPAQSRP